MTVDWRGGATVSTGIIRCDLCKGDIHPVSATDTWGIGTYGDRFEVGTVVTRRGFWARVFGRTVPVVDWTQSFDAHQQCIDRLFEAVDHGQ